MKQNVKQRPSTIRKSVVEPRINIEEKKEHMTLEIEYDDEDDLDESIVMHMDEFVAGEKVDL
jgi:hypothetical protein